MIAARPQPGVSRSAQPPANGCSPSGTRRMHRGSVSVRHTASVAMGAMLAALCKHAVCRSMRGILQKIWDHSRMPGFGLRKPHVNARTCLPKAASMAPYASGRVRRHRGEAERVGPPAAIVLIVLSNGTAPLGSRTAQTSRSPSTSITTSASQRGKSMASRGTTSFGPMLAKSNDFPAAFSVSRTSEENIA